MSSNKPDDKLWTDGHPPDMSRQYKSMQAEMTSRINALEAQVIDLKQKLGKFNLGWHFLDTFLF
jgi:uncharacterized protein YceH (UPF0502 family)